MIPRNGIERRGEERARAERFFSRFFVDRRPFFAYKLCRERAMLTFQIQDQDVLAFGRPRYHAASWFARTSRPVIGPYVVLFPDE